MLRPRDEHHGLSQFDVSANKLVGMLPTTFGDLVNLQAIDVSRNLELGAEEYWAKLAPNQTDAYHEQFYRYEKMIPTEMGTLKKLQVLKMDNSRLQAAAPWRRSELLVIFQAQKKLQKRIYPPLRVRSSTEKTSERAN